MLKVQKYQSIKEVLEEVEVLINTHFFNEFAETKSVQNKKKVLANQSVIEVRLFRKTWRTLNCSLKTMKVIREMKENILCVGKRRELIKKRAETTCWCSKSGMQLNAKHIVSCCRKVSAEIQSRHDTVINIILNNILKQRGVISHEQKLEDRKTVRTACDESTIGTEHWRSDEWKEKGRVAGAKLKPDLVWLRRVSGGESKKVVVDVKVTSTAKLNEEFKEKDDKYREWGTRETMEKKVAKTVMVPLIISHDGAVHRNSIRRWKDFAPDIKVDWVRMAKSILRYNVVIVGKFFIEGSWVSEAWRKEHSEEFEEELDGAHERIASTQERKERLHLESVPEGAMSVRSSGKPPPHGARLTSAGRGNPNLQEERTNQPT